jgi:hypothetical protein
MNRTVIRQPKADKLYRIELTGFQLTIVRYALSLARLHAKESEKTTNAPHEKLIDRKAADTISEIEQSISLQMEFNN